MHFRPLFAVLLCLSLAFAPALAQKKDQAPAGQASKSIPRTINTKPDTVWFEFKQAGNQLMADIFLFNDEPLAAGQIPLKFGDGKAPLKVDSTVFDPKRAGRFDFKHDGIDSVKQTMRIGFLADISGRKPPLEPGRGKLMTIYFNLKTDKPYEVVLDTTTLGGGYSLLLVDESAETAPVVFKTGRFKTK